MPEVSQLASFVWGSVEPRRLWLVALTIGLVSGIATLELNPLLAIPLALVWLYLAWREPRLVGIAGALVGLGLAWIGLLVTAGYGCAASCWWSLPYGPTHTLDYDTWRASELQWIAISAVLLAVGVILTLLLARRLRGREAPGERAGAS